MEKQVNVGGRPSKLTPEIQKAFCAARSIGSSIRASAAYAGLSPDTPKNWMKVGQAVLTELEEDPDRECTEMEKACVEFALAVWEAESTASVTWQQTINESAKIDPEWAWRMLERWYPEEYSPPAAKIEHTGRDGEAIEHNVNAAIQILIPDNGRGDSTQPTVSEEQNGD
jgi:hypothetical protein